MHRRHLLLSLLSALLLSLPWFEHFSGIILFVAFVPLLVVEHELAAQGSRRFWLYAWLTTFAWNAATTWWIFNATPWGMLGAFVGNSAQMVLVLWLFSAVKRRCGARMGYAAFVALWIAWEWFYFDAEIMWPWLTLGNGFAKDIHLVQWYEITGALGGSLWVLLSNLLVFHLVQLWRAKKHCTARPLFRAVCAMLAAWIALPIAGSLIRFYTYEEERNPCRVAVLQPNIDPFNDKFGGLTAEQQQDILMEQARAVAGDSACPLDYIIAPETALDGGIWENSIERAPAVTRIADFCRQHPSVNFVVGATTLYHFSRGEELPPTARRMRGSDDYYEVYNTALQIDSSGRVQRYHKSKLVVGVEMLPYPKYLGKLISRFAINLGGTSGGLGTQKERVAFPSADGRFRAGVAVCYESIFGQYVTEYVHKGASVLFIITNDGWWRDTPGHRQHLRYASLRAIETRRSIARSANTGISAIIGQRGEIEQRTSWWVRTTLQGTLNAGTRCTPYVRYGDVVGRVAGVAAVLLLLACAVKRFAIRNT